jgi:hypothetical protein
MGMTRERKVIVGIFGIALVGLGADRVFFSPSGAAAAMPTPAAASAAGPLAGLADSLTSGLRDSVQTKLRDTLQAKIESDLAEQAGSIEFGPAAEWLRQPALAAAQPSGINLSVTPSPSNAVADRGPSPFAGAATPGLTTVMPTAAGGIATIDGVRLRVGQVHPSGFRLLSVGDRTATIERDGETLVLSMPLPR